MIVPSRRLTEQRVPRDGELVLQAERRVVVGGPGKRIEVAGRAVPDAVRRLETFHDVVDDKDRRHAFLSAFDTAAREVLEETGYEVQIQTMQVRAVTVLTVLQEFRMRQKTEP